ncbi:PD-(D/E)XK nuclease family protein [Chishuiella sp.]|uniref:PD-(D/E)XK nuclease family protein n=1 Tax=Chishuiella sp. TaxID=1969467 RepID=UPI0028A615A5|nr:PD-(D/E)XK nuclease family protein [Chishuiella sp.]
MNNHELYSYFSLLENKLDFINEMKTNFNNKLALGFNSFDFWKLNENKVSQILCFFLDPNKEHGQEDLYLKLFFKEFHIKLPITYSNDLIVKCEQLTNTNRRIDLFIHDKRNNAIISIENKIEYTTIDGINQVNDYITYIKSISDDNQYLQIYLAPKYKELSYLSFDQSLYTNKEIEQHFKKLNYEDDLIPLIHQFGLHTENERVRSFLFDFEKALKKKYMGIEDINEQSTIKSYLLENEKHLAISIKIADTLPTILSNLQEQFWLQMEEIANELKLEMNESKDAWYVFENRNYVVCVEIDANELAYGIFTTTKDHEFEKQFYKIILENLKSSNSWPIYRTRFSKPFQADFYTSIYNHSLKEEIKSFILQLKKLKIQ